MKIVTFNDIKSLNISPRTCVEWIEEALAIKSNALLPKKISLSPPEPSHVFYNTMPCILPQLNRGGGQDCNALSGSQSLPR